LKVGFVSKKNIEEKEEQPEQESSVNFEEDSNKSEPEVSKEEMDFLNKMRKQKNPEAEEVKPAEQEQPERQSEETVSERDKAIYFKGFIEGKVFAYEFFVTNWGGGLSGSFGQSKSVSKDE